MACGARHEPAKDAEAAERSASERGREAAEGDAFGREAGTTEEVGPGSASETLSRG
jgi:hypothetical protein